MRSYYLLKSHKDEQRTGENNRGQVPALGLANQGRLVNNTAICEDNLILKAVPVAIYCHIRLCEREDIAKAVLNYRRVGH